MVSRSLHNLFRGGKKKIKIKKGREKRERKGKLKDKQACGGYDRLQDLA
jgi:hypothetical protein